MFSHERFSRLMQENGVSNYKLAKFLGCSQSSVKNWMEKTEPNAGYISQIAQFFGVTTDYLLYEEANPIFAYRIINFLCEHNYVTLDKLCLAVGINPHDLAAAEYGKSRPLSSTNMQKIADYFHVPVYLLQGRPPFDVWENIERDRKAFVTASGIDKKLLEVLWHIDYDSPQDAPLVNFIKFVDSAIETATILPDGKWRVRIKKHFQGKTAGPMLRLGGEPNNQIRVIESVKAPSPEGGHLDNDQYLKFALWGDTDSIDDDDLEDVRRYAAFIAERKKKK